MKKNCYNCIHGYFDSDYEDHYLQAEYFACDKRDDGDDEVLINNLQRESYREKAKVCCELSSNG